MSNQTLGKTQTANVVTDSDLDRELTRAMKRHELLLRKAIDARDLKAALKARQRLDKLMSLYGSWKATGETQ